MTSRNRDGMVYIGIDPGLDGAIVALDANSKIVEVVDAKTLTVSANKAKRSLSAAMMVSTLRRMTRCTGAVIAIEQWLTMPKQGAVSAATGGSGWGYYIGILAALGVPYVVAHPLTWQRAILSRCPGKGKGRAVAYAERRWPQLVLHTERGRLLDGRADAVCLAEYARQIDGAL